jgi:hypothetical protein
MPMSHRELRRYHALRFVLGRRIAGAQAAGRLDLSERHLRWLFARLRTERRRALVPEMRGQPPGRNSVRPGGAASLVCRKCGDL